MKVGITVDGRQTNLSEVLWSNGLGQNTCYLAMVLQRLPEVDEVFLVACPDNYAHPLSEVTGAQVIPLSASIETLDVMIELAAKTITDVQVDQFRARGGRLISYVSGNLMASNFEEVASRTDHGDRVFIAGYDACWVPPQHWRMNESYAKLIYTPHTHRVPYIWSPRFLLHSAAAYGRNPFYRKPDRPGWKVGCFEPTIHVTRTFHLPFMVAEEAFRRDPDLIHALLLFGAFRFRETPHLLSMLQVTGIGQAGKVTVEDRHHIGFLLGQHTEAVISHQWENNLSYLYWETLYTGWPLIHNSEAIRELGYYYPEFDPAAGGEAMVEGLKSHDSRRHADRPAILEGLWEISVDNPAVQARYSELLADVMSRKPLAAFVPTYTQPADEPKPAKRAASQKSKRVKA